MNGQPEGPNVEVSESAQDRSEIGFHRALCGMRPRLRARAYVLLGSESDVDDAVQETYHRALQSFRRMPVDRVAPWLMAILKNVIIDRWRAKQHVSLAEFHDDQLPVALEAAEEAPWWAEVSDDQTRRVIEELPDKFSSVIRMRYLERRTYHAIAGQLTIPLLTSRIDHLKDDAVALE